MSNINFDSKIGDTVSVDFYYDRIDKIWVAGFHAVRIIEPGFRTEKDAWPLGELSQAVDPTIYLESPSGIKPRGLDLSPCPCGCDVKKVALSQDDFAD